MAALRLSELNEQIAKTELEIEKVAKKIEETEVELKKPGLVDRDLDYWREKEQSLRNEKLALLKKEEFLRQEKKDLSRKADQPAASALSTSSSTDANNNDFHLDGPVHHQFSEKKYDKVKNCLGYLLAQDGKKQSVTIFRADAFLTYRHNTHSKWKIGEKKIVYLCDDTPVNCSIKSIFESYDLVWLKPDSVVAWNYPRTSGFHQGQAFYLMGYSPLVPHQPHIKLGVICSPAVISDDLVHGDVQAVPGDSAGPCVDFYTGALIGISLGTYSFDKKHEERKLRYGLLNLIVPSHIIQGALTGRDMGSERPIYQNPNFTDNDP